MNINGGKPIGSGGFGCVFRPALKCSKSNTRKKNTVTKMLQSTRITIIISVRWNKFHCL